MRRALLGLVGRLTACGSSGSSGPSSDAPVISNLRVSYSPANPSPGTVTQVGFIVDVADLDGDWVLGRCRFVTSPGQQELPIQTTAGVPTTATSGTAVCLLVEGFSGVSTQIDLVVVDRAGHQSNVLTALVVLEGARGAAACDFTGDGRDETVTGARP